jgi:hypothetical protein
MLDAETTKEAKAALAMLDHTNPDHAGGIWWISALIGEPTPMPDEMRASIRAGLDAAASEARQRTVRAGSDIEREQ